MSRPLTKKEQEAWDKIMQMIETPLKRGDIYLIMGADRRYEKEQAKKIVQIKTDPINPN